MRNEPGLGGLGLSASVASCAARAAGATGRGWGELELGAEQGLPFLTLGVGEDGEDFFFGLFALGLHGGGVKPGSALTALASLSLLTALTTLASLSASAESPLTATGAALGTVGFEDLLDFGFLGFAQAKLLGDVGAGYGRGSLLLEFELFVAGVLLLVQDGLDLRIGFGLAGGGIESGSALTALALLSPLSTLASLTALALGATLRAEGFLEGLELLVGDFEVVTDFGVLEEGEGASAALHSTGAALASLTALSALEGEDVGVFVDLALGGGESHRSEGEDKGCDREFDVFHVGFPCFGFSCSGVWWFRRVDLVID